MAQQLELPLGDDVARIAALNEAGLRLTVVKDGNEFWIASFDASNSIPGRHVTPIFKLTVLRAKSLVC